MDVNSGYIGHSMSRRAAEAYEDGEMPKSKWTKKAMVAAIQAYCDEFDMFFAPDTVAAFAHEHPECCHERVSRKGNRILSYIDYLGHEQVCPIDRIGETHLHGFDATEPGSFDRAIECHQLHSTRGMPGDDRITLGGEAQAMKAASAEMADSAGKHDIGLDAR